MLDSLLSTSSKINATNRCGSTSLSYTEWRLHLEQPMIILLEVCIFYYYQLNHTSNVEAFNTNILPLPFPV